MTSSWASQRHFARNAAASSGWLSSGKRIFGTASPAPMICMPFYACLLEIVGRRIPGEDLQLEAPPDCCVVLRGEFRLGKHVPLTGITFLSILPVISDGKGPLPALIVNRACADTQELTDNLCDEILLEVLPELLKLQEVDDIVGDVDRTIRLLWIGPTQVLAIHKGPVRFYPCLDRNLNFLVNILRDSGPGSTCNRVNPHLRLPASHRQIGKRRADGGNTRGIEWVRRPIPYRYLVLRPAFQREFDFPLIGDGHFPISCVGEGMHPGSRAIKVLDDCRLPGTL